MFKLLKNLFKKEEPVIEKVDPTKIEEWFQKYLQSIDFSLYFTQYRQNVMDTTTKLTTQSHELRTATMSKKHDRVEPRVKNIVTGHKENYATEVERFAERVNIPNIDFTNVQSYQDAIDGNTELMKKLDELARKTNKSYQAAQHLFFDPVEAIFATLRELDKVTKQFNQEIVKKKIDRLQDVENTITRLEDMKKTKEHVQEEIVELEKKKEQVQNSLTTNQEKRTTMKESEEYTLLQQLQQEQEQIIQEKKNVEQEIFSFFSKLQKPLKKYQRIALDDSRIIKYLNDPISALDNDVNLGIVGDLTKLTKNLPTLNFEKKQEEKFNALIAKAESGYIQTLRIKSKEIREKERSITEKVNASTIENDIVIITKKIQQDSAKIMQLEETITTMMEKMKKMNAESQLDKIKMTIQESLGITISFSSS